MNKIFTVSIVFILMCMAHKAQSQTDIIYTKDGRQMYVVIKNKNDSVYKYRKYKQESDTVYTIAKANIDSIRLKNGSLLTQDNFKPLVPVKTRPYFDVELGLFGRGIDGISVTGISDVNAGIQFRNIIGIGASYIGWGAGSTCCSTGAAGVGVQIRVKIPKRLILKFDIGHVLRAYYGDDGNYISVYNYEKSNKRFIRFSPTLRFLNLTVGLTWASTSGQINDTFEFGTKKFRRESPFSVASTTLTIGLTFPK